MQFNFEKNLAHQKQAVASTLSVFDDLEVQVMNDVNRNFINPIYNNISKQGSFLKNKILPYGKYEKNIKRQQSENKIEEKMPPDSNLIDIMMETGTGKTYTYTKTIFELNKQYGIFKFIVVVPTLSIKAGTIDFLKSDSSREHFKEEYNKTIHLHIVGSQKSRKSKKSFIPPAVMSFVNAGNFEKNSIQVMIINAGMINSETMQTSFDRGLFDKHTIPLEAIAAIKPFMIIDEPHKFGQANKTWDNIQKMQPQFILRYGATFPDKEVEKKDFTGKSEKTKVKDYHNLIYQLTAVDSFNQNLVKGIIGHITEYENGKNAMVRFVDSDGTEASFELTENTNKKTVTVTKKESLAKIHPEMTDLVIESLNKNTVILSNGLEMKKGDKINPYSYSEKLQEIMIQKAIKQHFILEKQLLTRDVKIKPITLFFIDNIDEYRNKDGYIRQTVEKYIKAEVESLLKELAQDEITAKVKSENENTELTTNNSKLNTQNYKSYKIYLEKTLLNLSLTHGGYFSKDNSEKDEAIEKEINEILHDKQAMLDLENPRRFIFSKWTLREGWDNPNVFQICKLRSSGSEISKLQEVGRGLRLPVNEYGNRVKEEQFYLNYFVDFTENDFVDKLVTEINQKSGAISIEGIYEKLDDGMIKKICKFYETTEAELLDVLDANNVLTRTNSFKIGGLDYVKQNFPLIFEGVHSNKVSKAGVDKKKITMRTSKYDELKELWEKINEKVVLEYKFDNEIAFKTMFTTYLQAQQSNFVSDGIINRISRIAMKDKKAVADNSESVFGVNNSAISTMKYSDFLKTLSKAINLNIKTIHESILASDTNINSCLNATTIRMIKQNFDDFLMSKAFDKFSVGYKKVSNHIHPTKLTDPEGNVLSEYTPISDIGTMFSNEKVAPSYYFDDLYYDSDLEKTNIKTEISEVIVFTKIPKNSIKIPVSGGKSYSPDFAYVVKFKDGEQKLHFIVETKNVANEGGLRDEEKQKIKHAEKFFEGKVKIEFKTQFSNDKMVNLIKEIVDEA